MNRGAWAHEEYGTRSRAADEWVFLHAILGDRTCFRHAARGLAADGARVICADLPGHGTTPPVVARPTLEGLTRELTDFLDARRIARPILAGVSLGGILALEFALRYPDRLRGLVLVSTSARPFDAGERARLLDTIDRAERLGIDPFLRALARVMFDRSTHRSRDDVVVRWMDGARRVPLSDLRGMAEAALSQPDHSARLPSIECPTLVVRGAEDALVSSTEARLVVDRLPSADYFEIPDAGHLPPLESPQALLDILRTWWAAASAK